MRINTCLCVILVCAFVCLDASAGAPPVRAGIEQKLNAQAPLDLSFIDESGKQVKLKDYFHKDRPVVLSFAYYSCPMLCSYVLKGTASSFRPLNFKSGKDYEMITISFDPRDTPGAAIATKKEMSFDKEHPSWHFLTGQPAEIAAITSAVGYGYEYVPEDGEFAHGSGIIILTPEGKVSRYFYGIDYPPRDLRLALVEASAGKIGSAVDQLLLLCFKYDPSTGKYSGYALNFVRAGGILTVFAFVAFVFQQRRKDKKKSGTHV